MIRVCGWCKEIFGEKCPRCGCWILYQYKTLFRRRLRFECMKCGRNFPPGEGGTTTTLCTRCALIALTKKES